MLNNKTKPILKLIFILASISSLAFVPWVLVKAWILPLPNSIQEQVNQAIDHGFDGMIVYVEKAGKAPKLYGAGWHDRKNKIPTDPKALFKIASISKLYVALAITKLTKDNRLSLDDTLADYFPELVGRIENTETITLRLMVQHRSGIPNFTDNNKFWQNPPNSSDEALEYALDLPATFEPNDGFSYSNTNYLLLSRVIEKVTLSSRQQYFKDEIFTPLGLNHTFDSLNEVNIDDVMSGYYVGNEADFKSVDQGMLATAEDVGKFLRALNSGSAFDEGEQEIYSSIYVYEHTGLVPGYQSIAKYHKDIDTIVIQFNNTTDFNGYEWNLAEIIYGRIIKILREDT